jgi:hypothetical protein
MAGKSKEEAETQHTGMGEVPKLTARTALFVLVPLVLFVLWLAALLLTLPRLPVQAHSDPPRPLPNARPPSSCRRARMAYANEQPGVRDADEWGYHGRVSIIALRALHIAALPLLTDPVQSPSRWGRPATTGDGPWRWWGQNRIGK